MPVSIATGKVRGFPVELGSGRPAVGAVAVLEAKLDDDLWSPSGMLAADHAGYVSFALTALRAQAEAGGFVPPSDG